MDRKDGKERQMSNMEIYEAVRAVPKEAKKTIIGGRLKGMTDINPMWRIKTLTEQFGPVGYGWYYEVINKAQYPLNNEVVVAVDINLYINVDGEWSKPIFGTGGSKLVSIEKSGPYINDEAFKMAVTDAISVACKELGFGADVYWQKDNTKYNDVKKENAAEQAEETQMYQKLETEKISKRELADIMGLMEQFGVTEKEMFEAYGIESLKDMTKGNYANFITYTKSLNKKK